MQKKPHNKGLFWDKKAIGKKNLLFDKSPFAACYPGKGTLA
jgi:hypothetical protein